MIYCVVPPQDLYQGCFLIKTNGCGFDVKDGDGKEYKLQKIVRQNGEDGERIYVMQFSCSGQVFECCRTIGLIRDQPATGGTGQKRKAPKALKPFAHPETTIRKT